MLSSLVNISLCVRANYTDPRFIVLCSGSSDGGAPAEAQQDLLTVLQGSTVSHPLQGSLGLSQQTSSVSRRGQQRHGQVAAGEQDGVSSFPLTQNTLTIGCVGVVCPPSEVVLQQLVCPRGTGSSHQPHCGLMKEHLVLCLSVALCELSECTEVPLETCQLGSRSWSRFSISAASSLP